MKKILGVSERESDTIWSRITQGARAVARVSSRQPGLPRMRDWGGLGLKCGEGLGACSCAMGDCGGHSRRWEEESS